ncbi:MAG: DUF1801 domain-containing protein [Bacteroidota bacterium]
MLREIDHYFLEKDEPVKSCLLAMRRLILSQHPAITEAWKYRMPFFCFHGKMFCYPWIHKKHKQPYLGIVEGRKMDHPALLPEKRARMKILLLDPTSDIPIKTVNQILKKAISIYL